MEHYSKMSTKKNGFTLVELLVVISIIATLAAILLPNLMGARERAKDAQKKQTLESIKNALRMYYNDNQYYPDTTTQAQIGTTLAGYMPNVQNIGFSYSYYQTGSGDGFQLCAPMDATNITEISDSQLKCVDKNTQVCGAGVTDNTSKTWFVICAN